MHIFQLILPQSYEITRVVHYMRSDPRTEAQRTNIQLRIGDLPEKETNDVCYKTPEAQLLLPVLNV